LAHAGSYEDFFGAVMRNDASTVTGLLARGFDPNSTDPKGQVALGMAVQKQSWRVVAALLEHPSTDVNALNAAGESALMLAALAGDQGWVEQFLKRGARIELPGWSPLHYAATGPNPAVVALLLARGASIDAASPNGTTPLMMAARYGSEESAKLLISRGADLKVRNQRGLSAVDFARDGGRGSLAESLARQMR
jgi:ankyrin repeat protein